jgi:hypothetical protein
MRAFLRASATASILASVAACATPRRPVPPAREAPARVMVMNLEKIALRTSAYVELHAMLASEGSYGELDRHGGDDAFASTAIALGRCEIDRCALETVGGTRLEHPFAAALPPFVASSWQRRALAARAAADRVRAAMGAETEPIVARIASDLGVTWPDSPVVVDLVTQAPSPRGDTLVAPLLRAESSCFAVRRGESERVRDARVLDCVLSYAVISLADRSLLWTAIAERTARARARRAWILVAIHAVAATLTAWEPRHASFMRQSASAVEPRVLSWLAGNWRSRASGEDVATFAARYVAALDEQR